jgi:hypothetical protein
MMITVYDVNNFGKQASEDYVQNDVSLNESIVKLASANGLTRNQVDRVVETANNETYLSLLKTAKDKYVEFPLANTKEVFSEIKKEASVLNSNVSDYDSPPRSKSEELPALTESEIFGDITKVASEAEEKIEKIRGAEARKMSDTMRGTHVFLKNAADEASVEFAQIYDQLTHLTKQAVLNDAVFNDLALINQESMPVMHEQITSELKASLALDMPRFDFEKEASRTHPNPGSSVYRTGADLEKIAEKYISIRCAMDHYEEEHHKLQTSTDEKLVPITKRAFEAPKMTPEQMEAVRKAEEAAKDRKAVRKYFRAKAKKLPALGAAAIGAGIVYHVGKNKGITEQNQVLKEQFLDPKLYKRY